VWGAKVNRIAPARADFEIIRPNTSEAGYRAPLASSVGPLSGSVSWLSSPGEMPAEDRGPELGLGLRLQDGTRIRTFKEHWPGGPQKEPRYAR
jgi:hypothetical protein